METPKISVVVPVYNVGRYLDKCLHSLTHQTYKNLEIICVNDGSTDSSPDILKRWQRRDSRILIFNQENAGLSAARNTGLDHVSSAFVSFVDSDDYVDPRYIEILFQQLQQSKADFCYCNVLAIGTNLAENALFESWFKFKIHDPVKPVDPGRCPPNAWGKLFKMDLIKQHKIRFPKGLLHEDNYWNFVVCYYADSYTVVRERLYYYRRDNTQSITAKTRFDKRHLWDEIKICCCIYKTLHREPEFHRFQSYLNDFFFNRLDWLITDYKLGYIPPEFYEEIQKYLITSPQAADQFSQKYGQLCRTKIYP